MLYLDSSALVKLIVAEAESDALERFLEPRTSFASAAVARVEVARAGRLRGPEAVSRIAGLYSKLELIRIDDPLLVAASRLAGPSLRSLDAVHVAAAQALGDALEALVTYDGQMQDAARDLGLPIAAPGQGAR